MLEELSILAINNGLLPALFVALLVYVLRDTAKREQKYQQMEEENRTIIARLTEGLRVVTELKIITQEIHKKVFGDKSKDENEKSS